MFSQLVALGQPSHFSTITQNSACNHLLLSLYDLYQLKIVISNKLINEW
jgi:hypothetical protein